ncbi:hypothetical protein O3M35_012546 [Rhynocoris fuscipes]|uniref:Cytochrome P450 n=1 Tax=Rhynocoris fuscipes TaxID=488301 RepID=A0AAW1CU03_9HEMI
MLALTLLIGLLVAIIIWYLISLTLWAIRAARLTENIPGPKPLPIIGNALHFSSFNTLDELTDEFLILFKKYCKPPDKIFKIWLGPKLGIVLGNPKHIEKVLSSKDALEKDSVYQYVEITGNGLFVRNGPEWQELRKPLNKLLNKKMIESNLEMFYEKSLKLCNIWEKYVKTGEYLELKHYITNYSLDTLAGQ